MDAVFTSLIEARERGIEAVLITVIEAQGSTPARPGGRLLLLQDGATLGTIGGGELEVAAVARAREVLETQTQELVRYTLTDDDRALVGEVTGMLCGGTVSLFIEYVGRGSRAYIYGAGHVGRAVCALLQPLPYYVTVIDERPQGEAIPGADRVLVGDYAQALADEKVGPGGYFLISTPSHDADYCLLRRVMGSDWQPAYVGMLGSKSKSTTMRDRLRSELDASAPWNALYTPVGLDIGGRTPAEIAISIVAEMQAVRHGKLGHRHMRLG